MGSLKVDFFSFYKNTKSNKIDLSYRNIMRRSYWKLDDTQYIVICSVTTKKHNK